MGFLYAFKFNKALAAMSIPPNAFTSDVRSDVQLWGQANGLTPEEAVVAMVAQAFGLDAPPTFELAIRVWTAEGKVNLEKPSLAEALSNTIYGP
jgi:hypothetical protein